MPSEEKPVVQMAYLLPLAELMICWTLVFVATPDLHRQISVSLHPPIATRASEKERLVAAEARVGDWKVSPAEIAWLANMPGMWSELATSTQAWPDSWFPIGFPDLSAWRAILWPLAAMPFWLSAGRGLDWFLYRSRAITVGWLAAVLAPINVAYGGLLVALARMEKDPTLHSMALDHALTIAGGVWFVLGAITCCAGILQWRRSSAVRRAEKAAVAHA